MSVSGSEGNEINYGVDCQGMFVDLEEPRGLVFHGVS